MFTFFKILLINTCFPGSFLLFPSWQVLAQVSPLIAAKGEMPVKSGVSFNMRVCTSESIGFIAPCSILHFTAAKESQLAVLSQTV